jgi:3-deoxy-manno-octulosonate cytidylyltransferase (CMP-KDO synthetase)
MDVVIVIPARYGSSRFPGKPLAMIEGKSLVQRVYEIANSVEYVSQVIVATDDERIADHVVELGGNAVMTHDCYNGSERVWQVIEQMNDKPDIIINLQGDAVLTPPWTIQAVVDEMLANEDVQVCTPAVRMTPPIYEKLMEAKAAGEVGGTTVTFNKNHDAMYFSKTIIPFIRELESEDLPVFRHIGLYGYRYDALKDYLDMEPTILEQTEGLEQLRLLENAIPIRVVEVAYDGRTHWAVDTPEDAQRAAAIIQEEGELIECE